MPESCPTKRTFSSKRLKRWWLPAPIALAYLYICTDKENWGVAMSYTVESILSDEALISNYPWNRDSLFAFGAALAEHGRAKKLPLAIAIYLEDVKIFQTFLEGTNATNEIWIGRKINTVRATGHSTLHLRATMEPEPYAKLGLEHHLGELAVCGGGVPIHKDGKVFAVIIVSGLPHVDDHTTIVETFKAFAK